MIAEPDETFVGTVDEDFAIESLAGDVFLLGNTSWRILYVRGGEVRVRDAQGPRPIPFWLGERPGVRRSFRPNSLSCAQTGRSCRDGRDRAWSTRFGAWLQTNAAPASGPPSRPGLRRRRNAAVGLVPTSEEIVFERFFDESGGMQLVIHAPLGRDQSGLGAGPAETVLPQLRFRTASRADDDGIVLSLGPQHSVPIEGLFKMLNAQNVAALLEQALLAVPMF